MKCLTLATALLASTVVAAYAQGVAFFADLPGDQTPISTNAVVGGAPTGLVAPYTAQVFYYALFISETEWDVGGGWDAVIPTSSGNGIYVFNATNAAGWTQVALATNTVAGCLMSTTANGNTNGRTVIASAGFGEPVQLVVVGWSANLGTNIAQVAAGLGLTEGYLGESMVGGPLVIDDTNEAAPVLGGMDLLFDRSMISGVPGFTLGLIQVYPPHAVLTSPTASGIFVAPTNIALNAQAWTPFAGKYVTNVSFYASGANIGTHVLIATVTNSLPGTNNLQAVWTNDTAGSFALTAVATDNAGICGTSAPVNITVVPVILVNGQYSTTHSFTFSGHQYDPGNHDQPIRRLCSILHRWQRPARPGDFGNDLQWPLPCRFLGSHPGGFDRSGT